MCHIQGSTSMLHVTAKLYRIRCKPFESIHSPSGYRPYSNHPGPINLSSNENLTFSPKNAVRKFMSLVTWILCQADFAISHVVVNLAKSAKVIYFKMPSEIQCSQNNISKFSAVG